MTGVETEDIAHQHIAVRARPEMIELRANEDERPGQLHGLIVQSTGGSWFWTCQQCTKDREGYQTDALAWTGFLAHEDQSHTTLAPIVSLAEWRSRHAG